LKFLKCAEEGWRSVGLIILKKEVLHRVKEERNLLPAVKRKKPNWIGHI
jgi:hypothetical protein